jgi:predicted dehydrogenase
MDSKQPEQGRVSRRNFLRNSAAAAAFTIVPRYVLGQGQKPPSETLNIAVVGAGGMGRANINAVTDERFVAFADVDEERAADTYKTWPDVPRYSDFREMFDKEHKNIEGVIVATPDHTHYPAAMIAVQLKKHLYCQKPLCHSVYEVRKLTEAAREAEIQTQMGNQGHSDEHIRLVCEWVADGAIGDVTEVHAWSDRPVGGDPWSDFPVMARPKETPPVPETLDWDLWLGPAKYRPYHPIYCPQSWRGWWDYGTGALGDMGCHILDPAFWALNLGHPSSVQATTTHYVPEVESETFPRAAIIRYQFPARGTMPPVKLTWYDGRLKPPVPEFFEKGRRLGGNGAIFVGTKGGLMHDSHGAGGARIVPESLMQKTKRPPRTIPRVKEGSAGHERDWVRACKDGKPASASFEYGGPLTEMVLLGVLAMRVKDTRLEWDGDKLEFTNNDEANALVKPEFRSPWTL